MANHKGSEGVVKVGATVIGEVRSFSVSETADTVEDTTMGDGARSYLASLTSFTGSMDVYWDETDSGQTDLAVGASVTVNLYPEGDSSTDKYFSGDVIITSKTINSSFDGMVEASISFQGSGALSLLTVA